MNQCRSDIEISPHVEIQRTLQFIEDAFPVFFQYICWLLPLIWWRGNKKADQVFQVTHGQVENEAVGEDKGDV